MFGSTHLSTDKVDFSQKTQQVPLMCLASSAAVETFCTATFLRASAFWVHMTKSKLSCSRHTGTIRTVTTSCRLLTVTFGDLQAPVIKQTESTGGSAHIPDFLFPGHLRQCCPQLHPEVKMIPLQSKSTAAHFP